MILMKAIFLSLRVGWVIVLLLLPTCLMAQSLSTQQRNRVGIGVRVPTEQLHVDGTVRIEKLPTYGEQNSTFGYYTYPQPRNSYWGRDVVVVNEQGVVGRSKGIPQFVFYMPPILLPLCKEVCEGTNALGSYTDEGDANTDGNFVVNLYEHYQRQFGLTDATAQARSHATQLPDGSVWPKEKLMFFVIRYDQDYFQDVAVNDDGVLTYRVKKNVDPTEQTFMNIVFRVKE